MTDRCEVPGCQGAIELIYLDRGICWTHWTELTADGVPTPALGMALGVEPGIAPDATEEAEMARKTIEKTNATVQAEAAAVEQAEARPTAPKKGRTRSRKSAAEKAPAPDATPPAPGAEEAAQAPPAAAAKPKAARRRKPKVDTSTSRTATAEKPAKEELVVFAIRLTQAERDAIHQASGPRNATQFVRRVATAFANEDEAAFKAVLREARELRS